MTKKCQCACGCNRTIEENDPNDCCAFCSDYCPDFNAHPEWLPINNSKNTKGDKLE